MKIHTMAGLIFLAAASAESAEQPPYICTDHFGGSNPVFVPTDKFCGSQKVDGICQMNVKCSWLEKRDEHTGKTTGYDQPEDTGGWWTEKAPNYEWLDATVICPGKAVTENGEIVYRCPGADECAKDTLLYPKRAKKALAKEVSTWVEPKNNGSNTSPAR